MTDITHAPDDARCKSCGYSLRNLSTTRCPECGREFDPIDPATMHIGLPGSVIARFFLRPTGWIPVIFACIAGITLVCISRLPLSRPTASLVELKHYFHRGGLRNRIATITDLLYVAAVTLLAATAGWLLLRFVLRLILARRYHTQLDHPVHRGRRAAMLTFAGITAAVATAFGWRFRVARTWVRLRSKQISAPPAPGALPALSPPVTLDPMEVDSVLRSALTQLPTVKERTTALNLLISDYRVQAPPILIEAIAAEKDPQLRAMEIRLLGLYRRTDLLPNLLPLLDDPDPIARAAAIDAIGIIYCPAFPIPNKTFDGSAELVTNPPISLVAFSLPSEKIDSATQRPDDLPADLRTRLRRLAFHDGISPEREAAGRALLQWQGTSKFRIAEWGVWVYSSTGTYQLSKSLFDEIPTFVHQTGDRVDNDRTYLSNPGQIFKPIIHITSEEPLILDISVLISDGRPWFAFPLPDDYTVDSGVASPAFTNTFNTALAKLPDPRRGYKWISPPHDTAPDRWNTGPMVVAGIGVRWQTLLVSPEKLDWMQPPVVPGDERYAWWSRLRHVPSGWVSSRGETERFLYYDGPTNFPPLWKTAVEAEHLMLTRDETADLRYESGEDSEQTIPKRDTNGGIYIQVTQAGGLTGKVVQSPESSIRIPLADVHTLQGPAVATALLQLLIDAGLTKDEAGGLVDSWQPQFFKTVGRRFIRVMAPREYDAMCPMTIDPPPTELVRVGLVLSEFGDG